MRRLFFLICVFLCPVQADAANGIADPVKSVQAIKDFCLTPLVNGNDPAASAAMKKLPELPKDDAAKFAPDGARAFIVPTLGGAGVLLARPSGCALALHRTEAQKLAGALEKGFTARRKFRLLKEKREESERLTKSLYEYDGAWSILITISDIARPNGIQAMMTVRRAEKKTP